MIAYDKLDKLAEVITEYESAKRHYNIRLAMAQNKTRTARLAKERANARFERWQEARKHFADTEKLPRSHVDARQHLARNVIAKHAPLVGMATRSHKCAYGALCQTLLTQKPLRM